jgi:crotonobetaine/carnitine-CoA ligase
LAGEREAAPHGMRFTGSDTVWSLFEQASRSDGGFVELDDAGTPTTYAWTEIARRAGAVAAQLVDLGVRRYDRVAIIGHNSVAFAACLGGVARCGAIAAPLNASLTAPELAYQLADVDPTVVVADAALAERVAAAMGQARLSVPRLAMRGAPGAWDLLNVAAVGASGPDRCRGTEGTARSHLDPCLILYTSGSTDRPKGVLLSHRSVVEEAHRMARAWALGPDDVLLGHVPFFHVSGLLCLLFPSMVVGAGVATGSAFSARRWPEDLRLTAATVAMVVGPQIRMIMAQADASAVARTSLRLTACGLAVPEEMEKSFAARFDTPIRALSGSTESVAISYIEPAYLEHRWPSLGRPAEDRTVAVLDESGAPLEPGEPGELCIYGEPGSSLMLGYWNRPEALEDAYHDGWYHTGDIGTMDHDGYIYFVDRKKDVIKRSGENVSATEVERVICELAGVVDAAVIGRPDPIRDQAVVAFVVLADDGPTIEEVLQHCAAQLAKFKVPEEVRVVDELPRTSLGKIEKTALRSLVSGG